MLIHNCGVIGRDAVLAAPGHGVAMAAASKPGHSLAGLPHIRHYAAVVDVSGEITAIATAVLAFLAALTQ